MFKGNHGEWSEPYALLRMLADGCLYLGDMDYSQESDNSNPISYIIKKQMGGDVRYEFHKDQVACLFDGAVTYVPKFEFIEKADLLYTKIFAKEKGQATYTVREIEPFLKKIGITKLKAKSSQKNDIHIEVLDRKSITKHELGFSIKSQLGSPSTLLNAGETTNFTFKLIGPQLSYSEVERFNLLTRYEDKFSFLNNSGITLEFDEIGNQIFRSNLKTVDSSFDQILASIVLSYYSKKASHFANDRNSSVSYLTSCLRESNPANYDLKVNHNHYEIIVKRFLVEYALGMRPGEVWKRSNEASGGLLVVNKKGQVLCYHFYFHDSFEKYLFSKTKIETPSAPRHNFGYIFMDKGNLKINLNLQIRFMV